MVREFAHVGLFEPAGTELAIELGLSVWMRRYGGDLISLRSSMLALRDALVMAGRLDPATEPVPLLGRAPRADVLNLAVYLGGLAARAAASAGCGPEAISDLTARVLGDRSDPGDAAGRGVVGTA
jgi:hypothetical protein